MHLCLLLLLMPGSATCSPWLPVQWHLVARLERYNGLFCADAIAFNPTPSLQRTQLCKSPMGSFYFSYTLSIFRSVISQSSPTRL